MATVTTTIGTSSRDYSTMTLWDADLDDSGLYASGDDAVGEAYNDSVFDETVIINGGATVGLNSMHLTAASGQRHNGTEGTGVRIVRTVNVFASIVDTQDNGKRKDVSWLEVDMNGKSISSGMGNSSAFDPTGYLHHNIIHGSVANAALGMTDNGGGRPTNMIRNIVYDIVCANFSNAGINTLNTSEAKCIGNTVDNIVNNDPNSAETCYGITIADDADTVLKNNIVTRIDNNSPGGTGRCYNPTSATNATVSHNAGDDTSPFGTGSLDSIVAADTFVSLVAGSEDYHLKSGAAVIDAGTDLVTTPAQSNIDIDGRDVDAEGDTWDMGADEFVDAGGGGGTAPIPSQLLMLMGVGM